MSKRKASGRNSFTSPVRPQICTCGREMDQWYVEVDDLRTGLTGEMPMIAVCFECGNKRDLMDWSVLEDQLRGGASQGDTDG